MDVYIRGYPRHNPGISGYRTHIEISGYPDIWISAYPDIRISGYPDIRISVYPDIRISPVWGRVKFSMLFRR